MTLARNRSAKRQREVDAFTREVATKQHQQRLENARSAVYLAKRAWGDQLKQIRSACRQRHEAIKQRAQAERARLAALVAAERAEVSGGCGIGRDVAGAARKQAIAEAMAMVELEKREWAQDRRLDRRIGERERERAKGRNTSIAARMAERDDFVEQNLAPEQIPYWRKMKGEIYARQKELAAQGRYATPDELFSERWQAEQEAIEADMEAKYTAETSDEENAAALAAYEAEQADKTRAYEQASDADEAEDRPFREDSDALEPEALADDAASFDPSVFDAPPTPPPAGKAPRARAGKTPRARKAAPEPETFKIALGRLDPDVEIVSPGRADLGERPTTREIMRPVSVMWLNAGTLDDVGKAKAYAAREGYSVFTYPTSEPDPLGATRQALAASAPREPAASAGKPRPARGRGAKAAKTFTADDLHDARQKASRAYQAAENAQSKGQKKNETREEWFDRINLRSAEAAAASERVSEIERVVEPQWQTPEPPLAAARMGATAAGDPRAPLPGERHDAYTARMARLDMKNRPKRYTYSDVEKARRAEADAGNAALSVGSAPRRDETYPAWNARKRKADLALQKAIDRHAEIRRAYEDR